MLPPAQDIRDRAFEIIRDRSFRFGDFVLHSGARSKYYLDMKPTMFDPEGVGLLAGMILDRLKESRVDYVGGLEMGAVPLIAPDAQAHAAMPTRFVTPSLAWMLARWVFTVPGVM